MTDTITLPRSVVAGALHALDLSQALLESSKSIHHTTILEEYKALRAALAQQADQGWVRVPVELTPEMIEAYLQVAGKFQSAKSDWSAFLSAAPKGGV